MAVIYPLDVPLEEFSQVEVEGVDVNTLQIATFTGQERPQEFEGDYWNVTLQYDNLNDRLGRQLSAFVKSLRKSVGTFVVRFPGYGQPFGAAKDIPSSPLVDGDGQAGNRVLNIKSAPVSVADWLLAGDIIQVGPDTRPHWHEVLNDVTTAADGKATIDIWPALRKTTINNDVIVTSEPRGLCRLKDSVRIPITYPVLYSITLDCREATG
ncbi:MAG: hypothetical protein ACR2QF_05640 [Geminicoccaceae bacterium]